MNATLDITSFRETCYPSIGGIDHSTPVVVGAPPMALNEQLPLPATGSAGCRPTVAYVGAADGMLHAIYIAPPPPNDAAGNVCAALSGCTYQPGEEIWAFMPNQSLPVVHTGGNCAHALFVDGVPVVKDVYANFTTNPNNPPTWHTVLTETMGQGGNHLFALDVTDPLAPVRTSATGCALPITEASLHAAGTILWEQGDPLDPFDPKPYFDPAGAYAWTNGTPVFQDTVTEGPGFPATGLSPTNPPIGTYHHYLGQSSTVFIGTLLGSGAQQSVTYVAGQNGSASQIDGFGRHIPNLTHCSGGCSRKDFSSGGALGSGALDVSSQHGPQGEVVYAFDSASGVARTSQTALGLSVIQHFAELYSYAPGRSGGFNDIPAPVLGVSTSNHPAADLLLVPDLDGELWGLRPTTLTSVESYGSPPTPFPAFDVQRYGNAVAPRFKCAPSLGAPLPSLLSQAAFGNPGAVLPPGSCPGAGNGTNDTVVIYPTGGVDWGPAASVISAIDVSVDDFQINPNGTPAAPSGVAAAVANDGWAELMPVQTGTPVCTGIQTPTCEHAFLPSKCLGRVFGQPLVVGGDVFYTTSTGVLTGSGSSIDQQNGDGTISTLGGGSSACLSTDNCLCQTTETSVDLASNVGKVASGLSAIPLPAGGTTMQIFSASTTGLSSLQVNVVQTATSLLNKLVLQQWWLRPQRPTPCAGTPGIPGCN